MECFAHPCAENGFVYKKLKDSLGVCLKGQVYSSFPLLLHGWQFAKFKICDDFPKSRTETGSLSCRGFDPLIESFIEAVPLGTIYRSKSVLAVP